MLTCNSHRMLRPGAFEKCQSNMFSLEGKVSNINIYCLITVGTTNMITQNGKTLASHKDNVNVFPDTIALFRTPTIVTTAFSLIGWNHRGCYIDSIDRRTLRNRLGVPGGAAGMSIEACLEACAAAGYSLAGVEFASECCGLPIIHSHYLT